MIIVYASRRLGDGGAEPGGESVGIEVYKRPDGKYAIPEITNASELAVKNILNFISLAAGAVLGAASGVTLALTVKKIRALEAGIKSGDKDGGGAP